MTRKVIVLGLDGMDPVLTEQMIQDRQLPNFYKLCQSGGYRRLGSSIPPQSPVAWANFINGSGPGSHGIFDFIHRDPSRQCHPFFSGCQTIPAEGAWEVGQHRIPLTFWPFNHQQAQTRLQRQGVPFWDYLDAAEIPSQFYDLPSNYPPSPSRFGNHRCLAGMGTPDLLGTYGTYQFFSEDITGKTILEPGGSRSPLIFQNQMAQAKLIGPQNDFLKKPQPVAIPFCIYRDRQSKAAAIDIQKHKVLLREGQWSDWVKLDFNLTMPDFLPDQQVPGICRFYLQQVTPYFRLYVSPINIDPGNPAVTISEPKSFIQEIAGNLGFFYTTGFQEDHKVRSNQIFSDQEFLAQAEYVLQERLNLLEYALRNFKEGLLFFYFSSTDLQAHMLWWDSEQKHPVRSRQEAQDAFAHLKNLYRRMDRMVGEVINRFGNQATLIILSDHGFANFGRQFNLNSWLRANGYIQPISCQNLLQDVDWSGTSAYGLGLNGLYLNRRGRERDGVVNPGSQVEKLLDELIVKLKTVRDADGKPVIKEVHRTNRIYNGPHTALAPDLIVGYYRGYRSSWATSLGGMTDDILLDNDSAWSADHCADVSEVPGILFSNRPFVMKNPTLTDLAPTILAEFGLNKSPTMTGENIFTG